VLSRYETIEKYILAERLHWTDPPETHSTIPYSDPRKTRQDLQADKAGDYQIRLNDHPYGFTPDIVHIVVWSALRFSPHMGNDERTKVYKQFIQTHFGHIPKDRLRWFVNWGVLQSVPGLEV
jgi:hypothetical protein